MKSTNEKLESWEVAQKAITDYLTAPDHCERGSYTDISAATFTMLGGSAEAIYNILDYELSIGCLIKELVNMKKNGLYDATSSTMEMLQSLHDFFREMQCNLDIQAEIEYNMAGAGYGSDRYRLAIAEKYKLLAQLATCQHKIDRSEESDLKAA